MISEFYSTRDIYYLQIDFSRITGDKSVCSNVVVIHINLLASSGISDIASS